MKCLVSLFLLCLFHFPTLGLTKKCSPTGYVTDTSGVPLAGVKVSLHESFADTALYTTYTNAEGFFRFDSIPVDSYWRIASLKGYYKSTQLVWLDPGNINWNEYIVLKRTPTLLQRTREKMADYDQWIFNVNIHQGWRTMGEISFGRGDYEHSYAKRLKRGAYWEFTDIEKFQIGSEFNFSTDKPLIGPKISWDQTNTIVTRGISLIYYTDLKLGTLYLKPYLGISFGSWANLVVGYNIPVMRNYMKPRVNRFTVTLQVPLLNRKSDKG